MSRVASRDVVALPTIAWFTDQLLQVSPGLRALWLPRVGTTTTTTDYSGRVYTYDATIASRISTQGNGIVVSFSAVGQYATTPDTADLSALRSTSGTANAAVTTDNTTLTDTRLALSPNAWVGTVVTCNLKTMTVTSNTATTFTGASWSGGGNPGNGNSWTAAGDGLMSFAVLANVTDTANLRTFLSKFGATNLVQEWDFGITTTDTLRLILCDASANAFPSRISNAAITMGALHLFGASYTCATGGATAANDMTLYQDAAVIASTAGNAAGYVAMEDTTGTVGLGATNGGANDLMSGSLGFVALWIGAALSTAQHLAIKNAVNTYYKLAL